MKNFSIVFVSLLFLGCSTRNSIMPRNLLNVGGGLSKPTSETGMMGTAENNLDVGNTFSAFLWPNKPNIPLRLLSRDVTKYSESIDTLTKEYRERNARILKEQTFMTTWSCNKETDKPAQQNEPKDCEEIIVDPNGGRSAACSCLYANDPLLKKQNLDNLNSRLELGGKIIAMVEDDWETGNNWLMGGGELATRVGSQLKIKPPAQTGAYEVYLRLKHFGREGMTYKTGAPDDNNPDQGQILGAKYDPKTSLLEFALVEKVDGQKTGNVYYFQMERGLAPSKDLTRFKGNLKKVGPLGITLAVGAAKFDGEWSDTF
jgi:hypothetical protein